MNRNVQWNIALRLKGIYSYIPLEISRLEYFIRGQIYVWIHAIDSFEVSPDCVLIYFRWTTLWNSCIKISFSLQWISWSQWVGYFDSYRQNLVWMIWYIIEWTIFTIMRPHKVLDTVFFKFPRMLNSDISFKFVVIYKDVLVFREARRTYSIWSLYPNQWSRCVQFPVKTLEGFSPYYNPMLINLCEATGELHGTHATSTFT